MHTVLRAFVIDSPKTNFSYTAGEWVILPGDNFKIVTTQHLRGDPIWQNHFISALKGMEAAACYCSMYNDCWVQSTWQYDSTTPVDSCDDTDYRSLQ
jgi:hypothetical protein